MIAMPEFAVDLGYDLEEDRDYVVSRARDRDNRFLVRRAEEAVIQACAEGGPGRVLDVGCGSALQLARLWRLGWDAWGLEPSQEMLSSAAVTTREREARVTLTRGIAERLPFRDSAFERVICKGSLDHFASPQAFVREISRVLKPQGRAVIALTNYGSLSSHFGRASGAVRHSLGLPEAPPRFRYWEPPPTHTFQGDYRLVRGLGGQWLEMERCFGVSLLWAIPRWSWLLERLPYPLAWTALRALDRIAYRLPALADMIVSTWRPRKR
jgi:SAM-dependent methyltransferase